MEAPVALVADTVDWLAARLADAAEGAWDQPAGSLEWTCRATLDHLLDDLLFYSLQLTASQDPMASQVDYVPVVPPRGGDDVVGVDPDSGSAGAAVALRAFGRLFTAALAATPADARAFHPWGPADPEGYAAIGLVELLGHGHDLCTGLGMPADLPPAPAAFTVARVFPDTPAADPVAALLWCLGRAPLTATDGHELPQRSSWRPDASVHEL